MHLSRYIAVLLSASSFVSALPLQNDVTSDDGSKSIDTTMATAVEHKVANPEDLDATPKAPEDLDKRFYYTNYKRTAEIPEDLDK
ncbi:hypothetical protein AARAC_002835 [Aspergillus arachidicola]|uniref:Uncharacterized protein n=1 Tax=Aspergillus arachidicola TaxID=656916 RepID=A0A2G7FXR1_9EURO|nr:hypothetical protein AARAC_002835 [Aspergillus arachidicola]